MKPFELSWMCCLEPINLAVELQTLKIGADTILWYQKEIEKYDKIIGKVAEVNEKGDLENGEFSDKSWKEFSETFLQKK